MLRKGRSMTDERRLEAIEKDLERLQKAYVEDFIEVTKQKGFDEYSPKWDKKLHAVARKYAKYMVPLKDEYNEICDRLDKKAEEERKKKFVDPS